MNYVLVAVNAKYIHSNLAVYDLKAYAKAHGIPVTVREYTINQPREQIMADIYRQKPDMLAFSCYIWNISLVRDVAAELHKLLPKLPVWVGGPEVSFGAESFLEENPWAAGVMRGEGEQTYLELLEACEGQGNLAEVRGITYREHVSGTPGKARDFLRVNPDRELLELDRIPFPYEELTDLDHRIVYYESSRGCPFSCCYCLSSVDRHLRFRSLPLVFRELQFFLDRRVPQVKFVDRTFNCRPGHAKAVWRYLAEHDNGVTNFHFEVAADLLDDEMLTVIAGMRPGLIQLEAGVQSTNPRTLKAIERVMDFDRVREVVVRLKTGGNVHRHLDLIAGLPYEDLESFRQSLNDVYALAPDQLQLGFLKVLKGSRMYQMADQWGCVCQSREPYEVLRTDWLSYEDVLRLKQVEEMVEIYHNSNQFLHVLPECVRLFPDAFSFFDELGKFYLEKGYLSRSHTRLGRYEILQEFLALLPEGREHMAEYREWMLFDLYERENLKSRPSWATDLSRYRQEFRDFYGEEARTHTFLPDYGDCDARHLAGLTHLEVFPHLYGENTAVLFSYRNRDPLHHGADWRRVRLK
ncbi:MAG TPA: B12-binding domain-containing radical SAM protein [Lachnospiraceae bacterium]|nr:B12-binding domain-containing radical SAM protein [Lachnospiraceae bacterium]